MKGDRNLGTAARLPDHVLIFCATEAASNLEMHGLDDTAADLREAEAAYRENRASRGSFVNHLELAWMHALAVEARRGDREVRLWE